MIGRVIFYAVMVMLAIVVAASQLDRQAQLDPRYLAAVPTPFRATSQRIAVELLLAGGEETASLDEARKLVRWRPMPAHHLVLFAMSAQMDGGEELALPMLEESARRGWREPITQIAVARAALLSQDYPSAAQRVAALVATGSAPDATNALLGELIASPAGREALVGMMEQPGYWQHGLMRRVLAAGRPADGLAMLARAAEAGHEPDCRQLERFIATQQAGFADRNAAAITAIGC